MVLKDLLEGVSVTKLHTALYGKMVLTQDLSIRDIRYNSREVIAGDMFIALRGTVVDGHRYIQDAIARGAIAVVLDDDNAAPDSLFSHSGVVKVLVPNARRALASISANFYRHPADKLALLGVTGTNGKTTTTYLLKSIFETRGETVGLIGTIEYHIGRKVVAATHTTPESADLNRIFAEMIDASCNRAVMEVSSHALAMHRVDAVRFGTAIFTNLTQDHLDFHSSMDDYLRAKRRLFENLEPDAIAVVNIDSPYGRRVLEGCRAKVITYGISKEADVCGTEVSMSLSGCRFTVTYGGHHVEVQSSLTGQFNVSNILAAFASGLGQNVDPGTIIEGIRKLKAVRGRFEHIISPGGWTAIVDYAHTPDALENCLRAIRQLVPMGDQTRLITVFGCGGNRDRAKRPLMGQIASLFSDITFVTSDNPRHEDPHKIIEDILQGTAKDKDVRVIPDRRAAIHAALDLARAGDVILIAGKGHETYQVVGDVRQKFDDRQEVEAFIRERR